ncbi:MAG: hypothetical protein NC416_01275 [Eubacterium sp.]|nr:hypothetical protein [Eubacterium sp.]
MKKKKIIDRGKLIIFLVSFVLINMIIYIICLKCPCIQEHISLSADATRSITSMQITISLVSITIMILFFGSTNERILGISYKKIFFHDDFFKFFNITNCVFLMPLLILCSVTSSLLLVNLNYSKVCLLGKIVCGVSLFCSIFLLFEMIYLGFILKYKQSKIYNKIYEALESKKKEQVYNQIIEKLNVFQTKEREYQQYIIEECIILSYICLNIRKFETNINEQERILQIIINKIKDMINKDPRDNTSLLLKLYKEAEKIFKKDNAKDLFCCNFFHK